MIYNTEEKYFKEKVYYFENRIKKINGCWFYNYGLRNGYGQLKFHSKTIRAHHFSLFIYKGINFQKESKRMVTDHICNNRSCVNPEHLRIITNKENVLRGKSFAAKNAKKTHCSLGHEFSELSIYRQKNGSRACRFCFAYKSAILRKKTKLKRNLSDCEKENIFRRAEQRRLARSRKID